MELVEVRPPEDGSSHQWGVGQSLRDLPPTPFTDDSILTPNLSIYENQTHTHTLSLCLLLRAPKVVSWFLP